MIKLRPFRGPEDDPGGSQKQYDWANDPNMLRLIGVRDPGSHLAGFSLVNPDDCTALGVDLPEDVLDHLVTLMDDIATSDGFEPTSNEYQQEALRMAADLLLS